MDSYQQELDDIITLLKKNTKGMTVSDIAHAMKTNRNSVAKYLDILLILGQVQMITFGPAKVYFPSKRIPAHTLMNYTTDGIIILDNTLKITKINNTITTLLTIQTKSLIGTTIKNITIPPFNSPTFQKKIEDALNGTTSENTHLITINTTQQYLHIKHLPITFNNGETGVACILTDKTDLITTQHQKDQYKHQSQTLLNLHTDLVFVINNNYEITQINQAITTMFTTTEDQFIGKKCYELFHGTTTPPDYCPHKQAIQNNQPNHTTFFEPYLQKKLDVHITPLIQDNGTTYGSLNTIKILE